jgi:hypothetical protein
MKSIHKVALCCFVITIYACSHKMSSSSPVSMNQEIKDYRGNTILLGKSTRQRLEQPPYDSWFTQNYNDYIVDTTTAQEIMGKRRSIKNIRFVLFMGTWCGDSRREVPRIYKLLDYCGISPAQVQLINLNNQGTDYKQSPTHEEKGLHIIRVPTLLVMVHNKETGRIVETPVMSWEKDLLAILSGKTYEPRYSTGSDKRQAISIH